MPRIYTSQSDPLDFCMTHFPRTEAIAFERYGNLGEAPDARGNAFSFDDDHPDYDFPEYVCCVCGIKLDGEIDAIWEGSPNQIAWAMRMAGRLAMHHLDGNPNNNALSNLQLVDPKENRHEDQGHL